MSPRARTDRLPEPDRPSVRSEGPSFSSYAPPRLPRSKSANGFESKRHRAATDLERAVIFNYCNVVLHARAGQLEPAALRPSPRTPPSSQLSPRMRETMSHLLKGDSEKQIATRLRLSRHTVHCYIKQIYRRYNVSSKGELFADWVRRGGPLARHR